MKDYFFRINWLTFNHARREGIKNKRPLLVNIERAAVHRSPRQPFIPQAAL